MQVLGRVSHRCWAGLRSRSLRAARGWGSSRTASWPSTGGLRWLRPRPAAAPRGSGCDRCRFCGLLGGGRAASRLWLPVSGRRDGPSVAGRRSLCSSPSPTLVLLVDVTLVDPQIDHRLGAHGPSDVGGDRQRCCRWRPVGFRFGGPSCGERRQHDPLQCFGVLGESNHPSLASGNLPMRSDQPPRSRNHIEPRVTKTPTNRNLGSYHPCWHRVTVAPHRHQTVRSDLADQGPLRWIRHRRKGEQRFSVCQLPNGGLPSPAGIPHLLTELIEAVLRLG